MSGKQARAARCVPWRNPQAPVGVTLWDWYHTLATEGQQKAWWKYLAREHRREECLRRAVHRAYAKKGRMG